MSCTFFFQAKDGIGAATVTGARPCAPPISRSRRTGRAGGGPAAPQARPPPALSVRLVRAADRRPPLRIPELRRGMTARPFGGLRVVLVAAFNRRYHRSGLALAAALAGLGCEVRRCEERRRGWNAFFGRSLATRLAARLRQGPADLLLTFKR